MKSFHPDHIHPRAFYSLFTGVIVPRPIAWILTKNTLGITNLAPYSFFSGINTRPPMLMVSIGMHEGERKHTALNLLNSKECVIHIVDQRHLEQLNQSGKTFKEDESEVELLKLETETSTYVSVPKLKGCIAAIECRVHQVISLPTNDAFILEVLMLHIKEGALKDGQIDVLAVKPLSRFMGNYYGVDYEFIKKEHPNNE
jgi:flavin reductase (DIM6/NTAB) family NADH-FMN oxidoreductase RutF